MLTVKRLLDDLGLEPLVEPAATQTIRWVHITELEDPTPWLSGGELLLTTGNNLTSSEQQREFVARITDKSAAGLGFGTGFDHAEVPAGLLEEARGRGLATFEIPYEMPFIAVTERAFKTLVNEQYSVLERGMEVHESLERLVLAERGLPAVMRGIAGAVGGAAVLLDDRGTEHARHPQERGIGKEALEALQAEVAERSRDSRQALFVPEQGPLAARAVAVPVPIGGNGQGGRWLVVMRRRGAADELERLVARQGALVVALELMRDRVVRDTERRLAGDVLAEALGGRLSAEELRGRLRPFNVSGRVCVLLFDIENPEDAQEALTAALGGGGVPALVAVNAAAGRPLLCALAATGDRDPVDVAREARGALAAAGTKVRAAASRPCDLGELRRAFHEARCALQATAMANGSGTEVASHRDLGAFTLLLSLQDDDALRTYADNLLRPIEHGEGEYGPELLRSLEAFIERNGQWERAARDLYCHRHTLRYRIRRIEELTGRDLGKAQDRIELWLALRARELVR